MNQLEDAILDFLKLNYNKKYFLSELVARFPQPNNQVTQQAVHNLKNQGVIQGDRAVDKEFKLAFRFWYGMPKQETEIKIDEERVDWTKSFRSYFKSRSMLQNHR